MQIPKNKYKILTVGLNNINNCITMPAIKHMWLFPVVRQFVRTVTVPPYIIRNSLSAHTYVNDKQFPVTYGKM